MRRVRQPLPMLIVPAWAAPLARNTYDPIMAATPRQRNN